MKKKESDVERAHGTIRLHDRGKELLDRLDGVSSLPGIMKAEIDQLNWMMVVDYDPTIVTLAEIRQRMTSKKKKTAKTTRVDSLL